MKIQSLPIGESLMNLSISPHDVSVRAQVDRRSGLADIFIKAGGRDSALPQFFDACALDLGRRKNRTPPVGADFRFVSLAGGSVLLLGVRQVVALDPQSGNTHCVFTRFRQNSDDHGFYHEDLIEVSDGIVLIYEGGAARISTHGEARWHTSLTWNDALTRVDGNALRFLREELDGSHRAWFVDLDNGSEQPSR